MIVEMQKAMEEERRKTNRLEKEMAEKTNRLEKETSRLKREMEEERNKTSRLETEMKNEQKKRSLLEVDVDDLKQSTNDIADWIVAGVCYILLCLFVFTHPQFLVPT
jgi:uncharacterized protein HemX